MTINDKLEETQASRTKQNKRRLSNGDLQLLAELYEAIEAVERAMADPKTLADKVKDLETIAKAMPFSNDKAELLGPAYEIIKQAEEKLAGINSSVLTPPPINKSNSSKGTSDMPNDIIPNDASESSSSSNAGSRKRFVFSIGSKKSVAKQELPVAPTNNIKSRLKALQENEQLVTSRNRSPTLAGIQNVSNDLQDRLNEMQKAFTEQETELAGLIQDKKELGMIERGFNNAREINKKLKEQTVQLKKQPKSLAVANALTNAENFTDEADRKLEAFAEEIKKLTAANPPVNAEELDLDLENENNHAEISKDKPSSELTREQEQKQQKALLTAQALRNGATDKTKNLETAIKALQEKTVATEKQNEILNNDVKPKNVANTRAAVDALQDAKTNADQQLTQAQADVTTLRNQADDIIDVGNVKQQIRDDATKLEIKSIALKDAIAAAEQAIADGEKNILESQQAIAETDNNQKLIEATNRVTQATAGVKAIGEQLSSDAITKDDPSISAALSAAKENALELESLLSDKRSETPEINDNAQKAINAARSGINDINDLRTRSEEEARQQKKRQFALLANQEYQLQEAKVAVENDSDLLSKQTTPATQQKALETIEANQAIANANTAIDNLDNTIKSGNFTLVDDLTPAYDLINETQAAVQKLQQQIADAQQNIDDAKQLLETAKTAVDAADNAVLEDLTNLQTIYDNFKENGVEPAVLQPNYQAIKNRDSATAAFTAADALEQADKNGNSAELIAESRKKAEQLATNLRAINALLAEPTPPKINLTEIEKALKKYQMHIDTLQNKDSSFQQGLTTLKNATLDADNIYSSGLTTQAMLRGKVDIQKRIGNQLDTLTTLKDQTLAKMDKRLNGIKELLLSVVTGDANKLSEKDIELAIRLLEKQSKLSVNVDNSKAEVETLTIDLTTLNKNLEQLTSTTTALKAEHHFIDGNHSSTSFIANENADKVQTIKAGIRSENDVVYTKTLDDNNRTTLSCKTEEELSQEEMLQLSINALIDYIELNVIDEQNPLALECSDEFALQAMLLVAKTKSIPAEYITAAIVTNPEAEQDYELTPWTNDQIQDFYQQASDKHSDTYRLYHDQIKPLLREHQVSYIANSNEDAQLTVQTDSNAYSLRTTRSGMAQTHKNDNRPDALLGAFSKNTSEFFKPKPQTFNPKVDEIDETNAETKDLINGMKR